MALRVLKFGGTSVADLGRLERVAEIVKTQLLEGNRVVVVVSAMAGTTDHLVGYSMALSPNAATAEHDVVAAAGEQVTAGLCALALKKAGIKAESMLAWQIPIHTDDAPTNARILRVNPDKLFQALDNGVVPVIAGFQGINPKGRLTTLGRGGSDTTAAAVAVALNADRCDIYTDVDGVYTADPGLVGDAKRRDLLGYPEMFEMASSGAKVVQARAVEIAMKHKLKLRVLSSLIDKPIGTEIAEGHETMRKNEITGVVHSLNEAKVTLKGVINAPGIAAELYAVLNKAHIPVDMMTQSLMREGCSEMSGMINRSDIERFQEATRSHKNALGFSELVVDKNVAKLTVVGVGLRSNLEIPAIICKALADREINIHMIYSSDLKMSVVINQQALRQALTALHDVFGLGEGNTTKEAA